MAEVAALKETVPRLEREARNGRSAREGACGHPEPAEIRGAGRFRQSGNVERHRAGRPAALSAARQHFEIGEALGQMDFEAAARLSGSRFVVWKVRWRGSNGRSASS